MSYKITQVEPQIGEEEVANVKSVLESGWLTEGKYTQSFIDEFKKLSGIDNVLLTNNGTLALYLAILSLDLPPKSEVLVPAFTFYATASAVVFAGHIPKIYDVNENTWHGDLNHASKLVSHSTRAIIPVHIYGSMCDMTEYKNFAELYNLKIIEDAAQAVGVKKDGVHAGAYSDISTFSFFADKTITMGEGAAICTNNNALFEKLKLLRNQGRPNSGTFIHPALGMNFRVTDMQAAVGCAQLLKLENIAKERRGKYERYKSNLTSAEIKLQKIDSGVNPIPFRFAITSPKIEKIKDKLEQNGIQTRSFFYPMNKQPAIAKYGQIDCPVAMTLYESGLALPIHSKITNHDIDLITELIMDTLK